MSYLDIELLLAGVEKAEVKDNAERQRDHVRRKQETHTRLQCWISRRHGERLAELTARLEDSQASLIEQAIDLLYAQECGDERR